MLTLLFWAGRRIPGADRPSRDIHWHARPERFRDAQNRELSGPRPPSGKRLVEDRGDMDPRLRSVPPFVQVRLGGEQGDQL